MVGLAPTTWYDMYRISSHMENVTTTDIGCHLFSGGTRVVPVGIRTVGTILVEVVLDQQK
jgi:hypothetical protein